MYSLLSGDGRYRQIEANMQQKMDQILAHYIGKRDELVVILQDVQAEFGYLPAEAMERVAKFLRISASTVFSVSTFYALFKLVPSGRKTVRVCRGTACHVRGGARILREIEKKLGIKAGETTEDMEYTLETVACIGACALAPNITIGKEVYGKLTVKRIAEVFGDRSKSQ